jgi:hypothetical protein
VRASKLAKCAEVLHEYEKERDKGRSFIVC